MKKQKHIFSFLLSAMILMSGFSGCSNGDTGSSTMGSSGASSSAEGDSSAVTEVDGQDNDDPVEISIAFWDIDANMQGDKVQRDIEDRVNIKIKPVNVSWDDFVEKVQLWAASDSLPDMFTGAFRTSGSFSKWANEGLLKEIPKDLSAYPNLETYLDSPETETCKVGDGIYCIFRQTYLEQYETIKDRKILYRWDLAQKSGITKEPENWDAFRDMIQAIKAADPMGNNIQGLTGVPAPQMIGVFFTYSMPLAMDKGVVFHWIDDGNGGYIPAYMAGETLGADALPTWNLVRDMYDEGTIEPDIAMTTSTQGEEKFLNGQVAAACMASDFASTYTNFGQYWKDIYGTEYMDDVKVLDIMPSVDGKDYYNVWDYAWSENYINAKVDEVKLDRILSLYDFMLSPEGAVLASYGYEGDTYEILDDGRIGFIDDIPAYDVYPSVNVFRSLTDWMYGLEDPAGFKTEFPDEYLAVDAARVARAKAIDMPEFSQECTNAFIALDTDFTMDVEEDFINIMTGAQPVEEMWAEIIEGYQARGMADIIKQVNEAVHSDPQ